MTTEITEAEYLSFLQGVMVNATPLRDRIMETITEHARIAAKQKDPSLLITRIQLATKFGMNPNSISKQVAPLIDGGDLIDVKVAGKWRLMPAIKETTRPEKLQKASKK